MVEKFSLKDHLFNPETVGQLAAEFAAGVPGFDADRFTADALAGFSDRELMDRLEWMADKLEDQLAADFPTMAGQLEAAMPAKLDPAKTDDDFGHFRHACPGILAVRHGLEDHRERALDLLHAATQRFSMEFYIRPFLNRWPDETFNRLRTWARDPIYHVRRLSSEGTRPRLPWAKNITIDPLLPLELLDQLHADKTRFVTRSVCNHLNDIAKFNPDIVLKYLSKWRKAGKQSAKELVWMDRHALRTLIKDGHAGAMQHLGYKPDPAVTVVDFSAANAVKRGEVLEISATLNAPFDEPVIVDYVIHFLKSNGQNAGKVFKWKDTVVTAGKPLKLKKKHKFKADATTFKLYPGAHWITLQANGKTLARLDFDLT